MKAMPGNTVYCQCCNRNFHTMSEFNKHNKGKEHRDILAGILESANRKVFVRGFQRLKDAQQCLNAYFSNYGKVDNVTMGGQNGHSFAVVEFKESESVAKTLKVQHKIMGVSLHVRQYKHRLPARETKRLAHEEHEQSEQMKNTQTLQYIMKLLLSAENLTHQMNLVAEWFKLDSEDKRVRVGICEELTKLFSPHFENCSVLQFGSSVNGFGAKGCDLDVFLDINNEAAASNDLALNKVKKLAKIISTTNSFISAMTIPSHRCPVVRFVHKPSQIKCDLSINNRKALYNSHLLRLYGSDPRVHKLVSAVRLWAQCQGLSGGASAGHLFTSYAITLIVLFFLMHRQPKIIPLVCDVDKCIEGAHKEVVDDWECLYIPPDAKLPPSLNMEPDVDLLKNFFIFCSSSVDWEKDALITRDATIIPRERISEDPNYIGCKAGYMTVLDPFVLNHNVVVNVNENTKVRFVAELKRAAELTHDWPVCAPMSVPWGIAAVLIPSPDDKTKALNKKAKQMARKSESADKNQDKDVVISGNHIEGEVISGEFCIALQPQPKTISDPQLLLLAKQNTLKPAVQWCIMAQQMILSVLKTVFLVEVDEVETKENDESDKVFVDATVTEYPRDECSAGENRDHDAVTKAERFGFMIKTHADENKISIEPQDIMDKTVDGANNGKRTSKAAHLDNCSELQNASLIDTGSPSNSIKQNPKKKFCEGINAQDCNLNEVIASNQVVDKDATYAVSKCDDDQQSSCSSLESAADGKTVSDDHGSNSLYSCSRDTSRRNVCFEALPASGLNLGLPFEAEKLLPNYAATFSDAEPEVSRTFSYVCRCRHQLWVNRNRMYLKVPKKLHLKGLALEQEVSRLAMEKLEIAHSAHQGQLEGEKSKVELVQKSSSPEQRGKVNEHKSMVNDQKIILKNNIHVSQRDQDAESSAGAKNCQEYDEKMEQPVIEFACQIIYKNCDEALTPHILLKLRPNETSFRQFRNFYYNFRSQIQRLVTSHLLESSAD